MGELSREGYVRLVGRLTVGLFLIAGVIAAVAILAPSGHSERAQRTGGPGPLNNGFENGPKFSNFRKRVFNVSRRSRPVQAFDEVQQSMFAVFRRKRKATDIPPPEVVRSLREGIAARLGANVELTRRLLDAPSGPVFITPATNALCVSVVYAGSAPVAGGSCLPNEAVVAELMMQFGPASERGEWEVVGVLPDGVAKPVVRSPSGQPVEVNEGLNSYYARGPIASVEWRDLSGASHSVLLPPIELEG